MAATRARRDRHAETKRLSVSLPQNLYEELETRALTSDVSLAWVVRQAVTDYLERDIPLLRAKA